MEIAPIPHPAPTFSRGRVLVALLVLAPVVVLLLLPSALGLQRHVVSDAAMEGSSDGSIGRGSLALTREVPAADLEPGDVITFRPPGLEEQGAVTRRLVSVDDGVARTAGDNLYRPDPWGLDVSSGTYARVVLPVPLVGYLFAGPGGLVGWLALAVVMGAALALLPSRRRGRDRHQPAREPSFAGVG